MQSIKINKGKQEKQFSEQMKKKYSNIETLVLAVSVLNMHEKCDDST